MTSSYLSTITDPIISHVLAEVSKKEFKDKISSELVGPLFYEIYDRCMPYYLVLTIILFAIVILIIVLLFVTIFSRN